jgi:formate dehydrogenase alpha subunit
MVRSITPSILGPGEGKLCIKGWSAHQFIHHPDRLTRPLVKKNGFMEIPWDHALDLIAKRLKEIIRKYGPNSIGFFSSAKATNEENYLMQKLARAVVGTNNVDHCARLCHASTVTGLVSSFGSGAMTNSQEDVDQADTIFVIGSNTSEQHPLISRRIIKRVREGAKLIVADPRNIPLSEYSHIHLRHNPGTDVALLNAMMNVIVSEGMQDEEFIERRTEGFNALKRRLIEYSPELVEKITGVPFREIKEAALIYGKAENAAIFFSMGITQHTTGVDNVVSVANLAMLTGNIGRPGTGVNPLRGQNNVQGACDVGCLPDYLPGYLSQSDITARTRIKSIWGSEPPIDTGLTLTEMIDECGKKIHALIIMGENPMLSDPDVDHVRDQLMKLELLVTFELFLSETAELADVVLPAASFAEKSGTFTATDRRVQLVRKAIEPIGDSMPDWMIVQELSSRLGYPMNYSSPAEIMDEIALVTPIYAGISHKRLETEDLRWPCLSYNHSGTKILHVEEFSRGIGRLQPREFRPPDEVTDLSYPMILTTGRQLFHWHTGTMTRRSETLTDQVNHPTVEIHLTDAKFRGIENGDRVRISTRRGTIELKANVTKGIKPGIVFIPFHYSEAPANRLTNRAVDPEAKIPEYKVCAARLERV